MNALRVLILFSLMVLAANWSAAEFPLDRSKSPIPHDLRIAVSGKVQAVLWMAGREDPYGSSLQIILMPGQSPVRPKTQVWLLKDDGTVIAPKSGPSGLSIGSMGGSTESITYAYTRQTASEAVAIVLCLDGQYFVKEIPK